MCGFVLLTYDVGEGPQPQPQPQPCRDLHGCGCGTCRSDVFRSNSISERTPPCDTPVLN